MSFAEEDMTGILYCMRYVCITRDMGTVLKIDLEPLLWMTLAVLKGEWPS